MLHWTLGKTKTPKRQLVISFRYVHFDPKLPVWFVSSSSINSVLFIKDNIKKCLPPIELLQCSQCKYCGWSWYSAISNSIFAITRVGLLLTWFFRQFFSNVKGIQLIEFGLKPWRLWIAKSCKSRFSCFVAALHPKYGVLQSNHWLYA